MHGAPNQLGAVNGGTALLFDVAHPWPAVTDPERSATWARWFDGETF